MVYEIKRGNTIIWSGLASGKQYKKIMQEDRLDIMIQTPAPIIFKKGDTIVAYGQTYKLNRPENISKVSSKLGYTYMIEFEALYYDLGKWTLLTLDRTNVLSDPSVYLMGDATAILGLLIQNANRVSSGWSLGTVENTDVFQWAYSGAKLLTVLQDIADRTNLEFWFEGKVLNLTRRQPQTGLVLEYGKGKGLYELMRQRRDRPIVTHLRILGGSQNIPNGYGYRYIQPLGGNPIVNPNYLGDTDSIEDIMTFENIYPRLIAKVTATPDENIIRSSEIDFDLNDHLLDDGSSAQIAFTSGLLNGFRFTVSKEGYDHATGQVTFNRIVDDGAYPEGVPNNLLKPAVGDSFVFLNIDMPQSYVTTAETRLRELANEYFADEGTDQYDWSGKITPKFILENDIELMLGGVVRLKAADIGYDGNIRIDSFVRDLQEEYLYDFTLNNIVSINSLIREKNRSDILANTVSKGISSDGLSTKATYAERAGYATMAGHSETSTNAATANFANTAQHAFNADRADRADHALDSDRWNGLLRPDYIDQPVRTTDSVKFLKVTSQTVNATQSVTTDLLTALSKVDTKILNATEEVNTKQLDADNANVTFHINTDTLTAETQLDTNILNALLQINTKVLNASERVNTDILQADSQVSTALVKAETVRAGEMSSESFVSGFAGLGYRLAKDANGNYMLELDRLTVRKDFTVYELIVSQIRATNGSLWVSDSTKIKTVTSVGSEFECKIDTDGDTIWIPFQQGDIVRCQRFNGRSMKYYTARVVSINTNEKSFRLSIIEGASIPEGGDDIVRIGSQSDPNRQGAVYLTASDNGAPFIDVIDGVNSASLAGKTKVRMGKLDGIIDPSLGQLSGYGLYANAAYIKGKFIVEAGSNVYTKAENDGKVSTAKSEAIASAKTYTDSQATKAFNDAKVYADTEIAELRQTVNDLETEIDGAFADGIIQEAEAISIEKYINVLAREKADIDNQYTIVYANALLSGTTKTNLNTAKTNLNSSYTALVSAINAAIQDGKATPTEKTTVDNAFADYKNKIGVYSTRVNEALEAIRNKGINDLNTSLKAYSDAQDNAKETIVKAYADGRVSAEEQRAIADAEAKLNQAKADATKKANDAITTSTNNAKAYTDAQINELGDVLEDLESTIYTTFQDGIIEKAEAIAIEKYINEINVEKLQLDNQYSIVYANANLVGTAKTNLSSAKTAYNSYHTTLVNSINNAIADGNTTEAEKSAVNTHFENYRTALGTLSSRIQEAIEAIRAKASTDLDTTLKAYASAQDNLKETIIKAYADGIVTEEEQRAIADAEAKLAQAKADATAKANQAKQDAISSSTIDAQNKANQAQANAIASSNQFALDAVRAINIGGRNLVRDSRMRNWVMYGSPSNGSVTVTDDYPTSIVRIAKGSTNASFGASNKTTDVFRVEQGKEYTLSFEVRSNGLTTLNYSYLMRLDGVNHDVFNSIAIPSGEAFSKVSKTITAPFSSDQAYIMLGVTGADSGWIEIRNIKFEKGNKATDWSPNPDEVEDALEVFKTSTTTKFEVLDNAIQSKVSQSDYNALNQRVGTAESTIIQHASQIQSKVAQTQFDTLNNTVGGLSGRVSSAESTITQQAGLIATKVTQSQVDVSVNTALGSIKVGGRNYITNSSAEWSTPGMSSNSAYGIYRTNLNDLFGNLLGKPLMISFDAKVDLINGATSGGVRVYSSNGNAKYTYSSLIPSVTKEWARYEAPINLVNTTNTGAGKIEFYGEGANANLVKIYIRNLKLEVGTKATDWSPAPEDVDSDLSGLKSRVSTAETSITQNANEISLRATKAEVTTAQNTAIASSKSYTDNSISVTNNAIALKADRTVTDSLNTRLNSAEIKITPEQINLTVKAQTESITGDAINRLAIGGTNIYYDSYLKQPQMWGTTLGNMSITSLGNGNNSVRFNKMVTDNAAFGLQRESANQTFSVVAGEEYTISFDIRGNIGYLNYIFLMRNEAGQANQQIHSDISRLNLNGINSTTYIRASTTVKANFTNDVASILLALQVGVTFWFEIRNVKVEKGNKATAWSPNPTEVDSRISSAETSITQNTNAINLRATKGEVTTAQNNAISSSKSYSDSQINVVNNAITLKSDKTVTDGLTARINSAETKITPEAIKSTVRAETQQIASDAVNSIQVGGRNIIPNSNGGGAYFNGYSGAMVTRTINTVSVPEWGASDATRIVSSGGNSTVRVLTALGVPKTGEVVTASGWFKNNGTKNIIVASNQGARSIILAPGEGKRIVFEGIEGNGVGSVQFQVNPIIVSDNVDFTWWRLQYEFGNKVTDWTPSPDDVENKVTALTTRVTNAETSITQTNNAIALKADKTVTDGLTNRISTAETKITPEQINLTVKDQTQAIANNASALSLSNGKMLFTDPSFANGGNGIAIYPNSTGTVMTRQTNITDAPTVEKTGYKFVHTGFSDDGYRCSLFSFRNQSRANAVFITRVIAKLPIGWKIADAHNGFGTGGNRKQEWLTPTDGTGKYEEYLLRIVCGESGGFSTINHFDLRKVDANTPTPTASTPIESYVAWATVYDMSDVQNTPTESEIKAGISITSNAINIFGQSLSLAGKVTFSSLDSSTQSTINTASSNASAANSKADSAIGSANTASSNASNALSTANTANSNASAALSTANTANSNATNAKSKTDAWSYASTTEIDGAKLRTGTVTADKINTDNLIARQIKTSEDSSRASLNEGNDGQFKVRHSNGQVAIQMGLVGGVPKIVFYDSSGNKVWEGGTAGIVYVNDVPESWTTGNLFFMDSIASATETLTTTKINTFKNKIKVNSSGSVTNRQMNAGTNFYLYSEGINATSGTNRQYAGYHTNQVKSVSNFIADGWYVFGNSTLFSDGPGTGTYSATVFKVFNGVVQDDYVIINGIS